MSFQATIGAQTLKSFTKCLACLARYGDDIMLQADLDSLSLSSINSSKSACCQIKFLASYFEQYNGQSPSRKVTGQLVVKSLLSILKHKTTDKILERCQLSIPDPGHKGPNGYESEGEENGLDVKLIVRLYCKHGIVKTHKLLLLTPTNTLFPRMPSEYSEFRVVVGPRTLKDVLEHFPQTKGARHHTQLLWLFGLNNVKLKACQANAGKGQLSTEISFNADEFESYQVPDPPLSIGFHIKEFNATVALAEALSMSLVIRLTEPPSPIFITLDSDTLDYEFLFIISTTNSTYDNIPVGDQNNLRKRQHVVADADMEDSRLVKRKPKQVHSSSSSDTSGQEASVVGSGVYKDQDCVSNLTTDHATRRVLNDPLFMPGASQLSQPNLLEKERSEYEDFEAMMDAAADSEVGMSTKVWKPIKPRAFGDVEDDYTDNDKEFPATQPSMVSFDQNKSFEPLFDD